MELTEYLLMQYFSRFNVIKVLADRLEFFSGANKMTSSLRLAPKTKQSLSKLAIFRFPTFTNAIFVFL